jgi:TP901 family phage tail tape measure protein
MAKKGLQLEGLVAPVTADVAGYRKSMQKILAITTKVGRQNEAIIKRHFVNPLTKVGAASHKAFGQMANDANRAGRSMQKAGQMGRAGMNALTAGLRTAQASTRKMQQQINKLTVDMRRLERQAKRTAKATNAAGGNRRQQRGGAMMGGMNLAMAGAGMTAGVTAPIVGGLMASAREAIKFESSFAGVEKTVDATDKQLATLRGNIRALAQEIPVGVNELNAIAEAAGQLGIETDSISEFTKTMAMMGATTNMSSDEAATAMARLANITNMPQAQFDKLGSTVVHLGNTFAATESQIVEMGLRIAGAGEQVGMTEGEILALATAASSLGIETEMGGSAMSRLIIRMKESTNAAKGQASTFSRVAGMTGQAFGEMVKNNPAAALDTFLKGLHRTGKAGGDVLGILSEMGINEIRLRDATLRLASSGTMLSRALKEQAVGWGEVDALTREAEKRFSTTESQLLLLKNAVVELAIQAGEYLLPAIRAVVEFFSAAIPHLELFVSYFAAMPTWIQYVVGGFVALLAVVGPLAAVMGGFIMTLGAISFAMQTLGVSVHGTMTVLTALSPALLAVAVVAVAFGPLLYQIHSLNVALKESLVLTGKLNRMEDKRHQETLQKAQEMGGPQKAQFLAGEKTMAEKDLSGRKVALDEAKSELSRTVSESKARTIHGGVAQIDKQKITMLEANVAEKEAAVQRQEDWVGQLSAQQSLARTMAGVGAGAPGVMGGEGLKDKEKTPLEKMRDQVRKQHEDAALRDQALQMEGLAPAPKLEGIEAMRDQVRKQQEQKAMREQVEQEFGIAKPPKPVGVEAERIRLQAQMQKEKDTAAARQQLGLPEPRRGRPRSGTGAGIPADAAGSILGQAGGRQTHAMRGAAIASSAVAQARARNRQRGQWAQRPDGGSKVIKGKIHELGGFSSSDYGPRKRPMARPAVASAVQPKGGTPVEAKVKPGGGTPASGGGDPAIAALTNIELNTRSLKNKNVVLTPANITGVGN